MVELVGPQRAGIIDIDVDIAAHQRIEDHVGAEALAGGGRQVPPPAAAARSAPTAHIARRRSWRRRYSSTASAPATGTSVAATSAAMPTPPSATRRRLRRRKPGLDQRQQLVDRERQHRGGEAAEQHEHPVLGLQAREDVIAEAGLADRRRQASRCRSPRPPRCGCPPSSPAAPAAIRPCNSDCRGVMPTPCAASRIAASTPCRPVMVLRSTGSIE